MGIVVTRRLSKQIGAGEFKAKCLSILDDVAAYRSEVVITKRGKPIAKIVPLTEKSKGPLPQLIEYQGDIVSPIDVDWAVDK